MSEIMTMCPVTGRSIPTGLTTNSVIFESLPEINLPIRCPRCGRQHVWSKSKAWVARIPGFLVAPSPAIRPGYSDGLKLPRVAPLRQERDCERATQARE
jgi:hypothetical protein